MSQLVLNNPSATLLVRIGDALVAEGSPDYAAQVYRSALAACTTLERGPIVSRLGFTSKDPAYARQMLNIQQAIEVEYPNRGAFVSSGMAVWLRTQSFLDDARFMALAEKHDALLPIPNWHWNLNVALWAALQGLKVDGDFVELGVFKGHTTLFLAEYLDFAAVARSWWLYDTFEGIPAEQQNAGWSEVNKNLYVGTYGFEEVRARFAGFPNIEVIKGRVPEALDRCPDRIAFLHVDLNSAVAEIAALERIYDRVTPGGVILFDDYCWMSAWEQHAAEQAWLAARGVRVLEMPTGQGLVIKPG